MAFDAAQWASVATSVFTLATGVVACYIGLSLKAARAEMEVSIAKLGTSMAQLETKFDGRVEAIRTSMAQLETKIAEGRSADFQELRNWINGSFMRSTTVSAHLSDHGRQLEHLEVRVDSLGEKMDDLLRESRSS